MEPAAVSAHVRERPHGQVAGESMARYTGPVCRICRRHGLKLFLKGERCFGPKCAIERRNYPPGDHGQRRRKDIPSALLKAGDGVAVMPKARQLEYFKIVQEGLARKSHPAWIELDPT